MNGGDDFFTLSEFELFRLRFLARGGFFPEDPFARRFRFPAVPQFRPAGGISPLVAPPTTRAPSILATVPTRGAPLSEQGQLPVPPRLGIAFPRLLPGPSGGPLTGGPVTINPPIPQEASVALDLGNIITTLGSQFIGAKFGDRRPSPGFTPTGLPTTPAFNLFDPFGLTDIGPGVDTRGVCPPADDTSLGKLQSCRVDPCTGVVTLVKRTRRRRRALATARDIGDIAALMGVFNVKSSQPQSLTTWIATRGR